MINWLNEMSGAANVVLNLAMLLVWIAYLQVFVSSYRRQRRATILINVGGGSGLDARCLVSNMSQGTIYVRSLLLDLTTRDGTSSHSVTEPEGQEDWTGPTDLKLWTRQGPIDPGGIRDMGPFGAMLDHVVRTKHAQNERSVSADLSAIVQVRVTVVAQYGPEDLMVAAEQTYAVNRLNSSPRLVPQATTSRQIRSRRERARLRERLERMVES